MKRKTLPLFCAPRVIATFAVAAIAAAVITPAHAQKWEELSLEQMAGRSVAIAELCREHADMYVDDPRVERIKESPVWRGEQFQAAYQQIYDGFGHLYTADDIRPTCPLFDSTLEEFDALLSADIEPPFESFTEQPDGQPNAQPDAQSDAQPKK